MKNYIKNFLKRETKQYKQLSNNGYYGKFIYDIPLTNFMEENKDFLWKIQNFFKELTIENNIYIINDDVSIKYRFKTGYIGRIEGVDYCLLYKNNPIITIENHTPNNRREIKLIYSDKPFPSSGGIDICGQYGAGYFIDEVGKDDSKFYYNENKYLSADETLKIMEKFVDILKSLNYKEEVVIPKKVEDTKLKNLENVKKFLA